MFVGRAQLRTIEPSETIFKLIPDICNSIHVNLKYSNETDHYTYARLEQLDQSLFEWGFHILLKKEKKDTELDLFVEYEGVFEPSKKFIQNLLDALEKRITIKKTIHPNDWRFYEMEKTESGLLKIDGKMEEIKGFLKKKTLQPVIKFKYDVKPLGNYTNKTAKKIEKLLIMIGETHEIQLKKDDDDSPPLFTIPYESIKKAEIIKYDKGLLHLADFVLSITFHESYSNTTPANSLKDLYEQEFDHSLILETKKSKDLAVIAGQISTILDSRDNRKQRLQLLSSLQGMRLCTNCCLRSISFFFSFEQICDSCFADKYGKIILSAHNGEYHGGHKVYLAGGKLSECEYGNMYLTDKYFIFLKINSETDKKQNWEIIIPFESVQMEQWGLQEGSRRRDVLLGGGLSDDSYGLGGGFIHESGKRHRLIIPYIDENGVKQVPIFGISSLRGDLIKIWASNIYQVFVKNMKVHPHKGNTLQLNKTVDNDPLVILKMRFAKGEISKEEFEDMKNLLESK
jgi:hypothetical protein